MWKFDLEEITMTESWLMFILQQRFGSLLFLFIWVFFFWFIQNALCVEYDTIDSINNFVQVHDELVLEADPSIIKEAGFLLKTSMECAASLLGKVKTISSFVSFLRYVFADLFCFSQFFQSLCRSNWRLERHGVRWSLFKPYKETNGSYPTHILW